MITLISNKNQKQITIDLSKQQVLDADPKAIKQINFTGNLDCAGNNNIFQIQRSKQNYFRFFTRNCASIVNTQ